MKPRKTGGSFVGTRGCNYRHWADGIFYPPECRPPEWLGFYAAVLDAVEVNNTFYHLPTPGVFAKWHDATPARFTFAVKASRFITHMKKLAEPEEHVARFLNHAAELRNPSSRSAGTPGTSSHAYFNNDAGGHAVRDAVRDALRLREQLAKRPPGIQPSHRLPNCGTQVRRK